MSLQTTLGAEVQHEIDVTRKNIEEEVIMAAMNMKQSPTGTDEIMVMANAYDFTVRTLRMSTTGVGNISAPRNVNRCRQYKI